MTDKKWIQGYNSEGYSVIRHDDYGDIPAWNDVTGAALVRVLNEGVLDTDSYPTEEQGDAYMDGWFDGATNTKE